MSRSARSSKKMAKAAVFTFALLSNLGVVLPVAAQAAGPNGPTIQDGYTCTKVGTSGNDTITASAGDVVCGMGGNDTITATGSGTIVLVGGTGNDKLVGSTTPGSSEVIIGGNGNDTIISNAGNDTISGGAGNDTITGGTGNDRLSGNVGNDTITAGSGTDVVSGGAGSDLITGGSGADTLNGDGGNDTIHSGTGVDVINGGDGNDTITGGTGAGADDVIDGGAGNDTISGGAGPETLNGGTGNDTITGGSGTDVLNGGLGSDQLNAGTGNDSVNGGSGGDTLVGGPGTDTLNGEDGNDTLTAGSGTNILNGGAGNDVLNGGSGDDTLNGDDGNDTINAGTGVQVMDGGNGTNNFKQCASGANVAIVGRHGGDHEDGGCASGAVGHQSQRWSGTVALVASDSSTITVTVTDSSGGAQQWLASQIGCTAGTVTFDLKSAPATINGTVAVGASVQIAASAGTVNCVPIAQVVQVAGASRPLEHASQWWQGTVASVASNSSTVTVAINEANDGARQWLGAQSPACSTNGLTFDLATGPASLNLNGASAIAVGDQVTIAAISGKLNCEPVATVVQDFGHWSSFWSASSGDHNGD